MTNYLKQSLFLFLILLGLVSNAQAECIVTTKDFTKSSRILYVNPTNGSDQLAKNYNYNLGSVRNPYQPRRIVAFQSVEEALKARNEAAGDLVLIKAGPNWANYDLWSKNQLAQFNEKSAQVTSYSQRQCRGEDLTWVPSAVTDTQSADTAPVTEFSNNNDISVANTELITPSNPVINQTPSSTSLSTNPTSSPRKSSGGSSSGGASSGSNTPTSALDNITDLQPPATTRASRNQLQNTAAESSDMLAGLPPAIVDETEIDSDVPSIENGQDKIDTVYTPECNVDASWQNAIQAYPRDSDGWSIIEPDSETRIVYVSSSSGSDSYARPYLSAEISDPFNPPSHINAYKTLNQAYAQLRDKKPDWILLKKGDKFELQDTLRLKSGKSHTAHIVISSYGDKNLPRPIIDSYTSTAIAGNKIRSYITISGIDFYASGRDPDSERFVGWDKVGGASGVSYVAGGDSFGIHIENNLFRYYSGGIGMQGHAGEIKGIIIRRNQVLNSYSTTAHSQGMFLSRLNGALIEENLLDHNGWYQQRPKSVALNTKDYGYATYFNHNLYMENSSNLVIKENISSRSSSIGMKFTSNSDNKTRVDDINSHNILLSNNLIIEGEVGFSIGGNIDFNNGYRWDNIKVVNNVLSNIGRTRPTNRSLGFNIEVDDWKTGSICHNTIVDRDNKSITNNYGIQAKGFLGNINISDNQVINLGIEEEPYSKIDSVKNHNNRYIPLINNVNYLDNYVKSKGFTDYSSYINYVRKELSDDSLSYYNVEDAIKYIKLQANY